MQATSDSADGEDAHLRVAKLCSGGPTLDGSGGATCVCYGCEKPVHWVTSFKRKVCGIDHEVRGHFRHNRRSGGCGGGESLDHKAAKDAVLTGSGWSFYAACQGTRGVACNNPIEIVVPKEHKRIEMPFQTFFLDVGVCDASETLLGAVEILHTSVMTMEKRDALTAANVAWVEVRANDVLNVYSAHSGGGRVKVVDCAMMQCDACVARQKDLDALEHERRVMAEVKKMRSDRFEAERDRGRQIQDNAEAARQAKCIIETEGVQLLAERLAAGSEEVCGEGQVYRPAPFWNEVITTTAEVLGVDLNATDAQREGEMARMVIARAAKLQASKRVSEELRFGKHSGNTVQLLFDDDVDRPYVRWLAGYTGFKDSCKNRPAAHGNKDAYTHVPHTVATEARALLKGRCLLCFGKTDQEWKSWCVACFRDACG